jgi:hypothetical protein
MFTFIKNLFKKTTDSIVADISAKIEALHVVAAAHAEAEKLHNEEIALRTRLAAEASAEYARAKSIATKFKELIS